MKNTRSSLFEANPYIGIIFNVRFAGYAVLTHAILSKSLSSSLEEKSTVPVLGILVFVVSLAEAPALKLKLLSVLSSNVRRKMTRNRVMIFFGHLFRSDLFSQRLKLSCCGSKNN